MKKRLLPLLLALGLLLSFSSCSSSGDDPARYGYLYSAVVTDISYDLMDFYDIHISFMTSTGVQETYTIKESYQIPQRQIFWEIIVEDRGDFTVTMRLQPKTTAVMDYESDYTLAFDLCSSAGRLDERDPESALLSVKETKSGSDWKKEGELSFVQTVTPKF